jgi:hypothetical protein
MAPIRDLVYFAPASIEQWYDYYTDFLYDCGIKNYTFVSPDGNDFTTYSTKDIKDMLIDPINNAPIVETKITKFVEEATNELLCIALIDTAWDEDHCPVFKINHGLAMDEVSKCWEEWWSIMPDTYHFDYHSSVNEHLCDALEGTECLGGTPGVESSLRRKHFNFNG